MALFCRRTAFLAVLTALTACADLPGNRPATPARATPADDVSSVPGVPTLLLPVTFINVVRPHAVPGLFEVTVTSVDGRDISFVQPRHGASPTASPGTTEFLFRITLPKGQYRITSLTASVRTQGKTEELALAASIPFTTKPGEIGYAGRLLIQHTGRSGLKLNTQWSEERDIEVYRSQFPEIASRPIAPAPFESVRVGTTIDGSLEAVTPAPFSDLDVMQVATTLSPPTTDSAGMTGLPDSEPLRHAYRDFLRLAFPRAFAISADGHWGVAAGVRDAPMRSLAHCAQQGERCRLYAVDDRVVIESH